MPVVPYAGGTSLEGHFIGVGASCPLSPFWSLSNDGLRSTKVEVFASICQIWTRSLRSTVSSSSPYWKNRYHTTLFISGRLGHDCPERRGLDGDKCHPQGEGYSFILPRRYIFSPYRVMINTMDSLILAPPRQSVACSARGVLEVSCVSPLGNIILYIFEANAVRYGTAKGEWFLNAVHTSH